MKKSMPFNQLPEASQVEAILQYEKGWLETREDENDIVSFNDIFSALMDDLESLYSVDGKYLGENL